MNTLTEFSRCVHDARLESKKNHKNVGNTMEHNGSYEEVGTKRPFIVNVCRQIFNEDSDGEDHQK